MFLDKVERRNQIVTETDWTNFVTGSDEEFINSKEQTYFTALNIYSNNIAKIPITIKKATEKGDIDATDHYLWNLLKYRPNENMNSFDCMKSLIMQYKHHGMAGLVIDKDKFGKTKGLYPVAIDEIIIDDVGLIKSTKTHKVLICYSCAGVQGNCFEENIIILRDNSLDGIKGIATRKYAKETIDTNLKAQAYQKELFSNGLTNKAVVQVVSDIKEEKELKKMQKKFDRLYKANGRVFTVPAGFNVQALNLNLADSQFSELKTMGKKDISISIGIPYTVIDKGIMTQEETISFLENQANPAIIPLEQEMTWKILSADDRKKGYRIKANTNAMLKTNPKIQQEIICQYTKSGIYSLEYARKLLGVYSDFENEVVTLPSGQILLKDLIEGKAGWQKGKKSKKKGSEEN